MGNQIFYLLVILVAIIGYPSARGESSCQSEDKIIAVGETIGGEAGGDCAPYTCESDGVLVHIGCGQYIPSPGCVFTMYDYNKPYPDCCPQEKCD